MQLQAFASPPAAFCFALPTAVGSAGIELATKMAHEDLMAEHAALASADQPGATGALQRQSKAVQQQPTVSEAGAEGFLPDEQRQAQALQQPPMTTAGDEHFHGSELGHPLFDSMQQEQLLADTDQLDEDLAHDDAESGELLLSMGIR